MRKKEYKQRIGQLPRKKAISKIQTVTKPTQHRILRNNNNTNTNTRQRL
jgi:hypothetical protein